MRYPWEADGLTVRDFQGYTKASELMQTLVQKALVKEMVRGIEGELGPDPAKAAGDAEKVLAKYQELVTAGTIHASCLNGVGESTAAMATKAKVWTFLKKILAGMEG